MPSVAETDDLILEGEELQAEGPCIEEGVGRVVVPSKGKLFAPDGTVSVAVIRPCVSRGKRIRGLPPIYEPSMLGKNASVFEDWHMWMGHMSVEALEALQEELEEQLQEAVSARRLFSELGGRVQKTWFDPDFKAKGDDSAGYRPGAVMGKVIPYPASRQILEADPDGLHVSIAAWPTSARASSPSWDASQKGMAIEGFRRSPRGSVDWVLRGGAGGRPVAGKLSEAEQAAVSSLGTYYSAARKEKTDMPDLKTMTLEQLREQLKADNPALARELKIEEAVVTPPAKETPAAAPSGGLTQADLDRAVREAEERVTATFTTKLTEAETGVEEAIEEALAEARLAESHEALAKRLITKSGLPPRWQDDLLRRYSVLPSGPSQALLTEEELDDKGATVSAAEVLKHRVAEDIQHARDLIEESGGSPRVTSLGGGGGGKKTAAAPKNSAFRDFLSESGDLPVDKKPEEIKESIREMVREGVS